MIRMTFDPALKLNDDKIGLLYKRLRDRNLIVKSVLRKPAGAYWIIIDTMLEGHILMTTLGAKDCVLCTGCNSMHYKTEFNKADPFVCPCGKLLNKPPK